MAHNVRVNAGQKKITLPDGNIYDGEVDVTLTDAQFTAISATAFPVILTDLGPVPDPGGGGNGADLTTHIGSGSPHPVYDSGPSLVVIYQNAKV